MGIRLLLWVIAGVLLFVSAFWDPARPRLGWLGLGFFVTGWVVDGTAVGAS